MSNMSKGLKGLKIFVIADFNRNSVMIQKQRGAQNECSCPPMHVTASLGCYSLLRRSMQEW